MLTYMTLMELLLSKIRVRISRAGLSEEPPTIYILENFKSHKAMGKDTRDFSVITKTL